MQTDIALRDLRGREVTCKSFIKTARLNWFEKTLFRFRTTPIECENDDLGSIAWWLVRETSVAEAKCPEAKGVVSACGASFVPLSEVND